MIVIAMTAIGWLALIVLFVAACHAARLGDREQTQPTLDS
jgi:hypothetical protein